MAYSTNEIFSDKMKNAILWIILLLFCKDGGTMVHWGPQSGGHTMHIVRVWQCYLKSVPVDRDIHCDWPTFSGDRQGHPWPFVLRTFEQTNTANGPLFSLQTWRKGVHREVSDWSDEMLHELIPKRSRSNNRESCDTQKSQKQCGIWYVENDKLCPPRGCYIMCEE